MEKERIQSSNPKYVGGSIRVPSAFNGLFGLRPSSGRLPYEGMANTMDGQISVPSVVGPISHSVPSLRLAVKAILSQEPWHHDPNVHEIPWREDPDALVNQNKNTGGLAFGVIRNDGQVTPWPPIKRAVDEVVEKLQRAGHKVIDWNASSHNHAIDLIVSFLLKFL
jgi:amidase